MPTSLLFLEINIAALESVINISVDCFNAVHLAVNKCAVFTETDASIWYRHCSSDLQHDLSKTIQVTDLSLLKQGNGHGD